MPNIPQISYGDGPISLVAETVVVVYELIRQGDHHRLIDGSAEVCALVKVLSPEAFQRSTKNSVRAQKLIVRWSPKKGLYTSKGPFHAHGSEIVEAALKTAKREPCIPTLSIDKDRHDQGKMVGVLDGKITEDFSNPNTHLFAGFDLTIHYPGRSIGKLQSTTSHPWEESWRGQIGILSDGERELEGPKYWYHKSCKVHPITLPIQITDIVRRQAIKAIKANLNQGSHDQLDAI